MTRYLIYRHGSNAANQGMCDRMPVAIVEARGRQEAEDTSDVLTVHDCARSKLAPHVTVWANQYLEAVPESKARTQDWNAVLEDEALARS